VKELVEVAYRTGYKEGTDCMIWHKWDENNFTDVYMEALEAKKCVDPVEQ